MWNPFRVGARPSEPSRPKLPPFFEHNACRKCGYEKVRVMYDREAEAMLRQCHRCEAMWHEAPLDAGGAS